MLSEWQTVKPRRATVESSLPEVAPFEHFSGWGQFILQKDLVHVRNLVSTPSTTSASPGPYGVPMSRMFKAVKNLFLRLHKDISKTPLAIRKQLNDEEGR